MARVAFTTRRPPALSAGKRATPLPYLSDAALRCTPLDPADPGGKGERVERLILESKVDLLETFVDAALDIVEGDVLDVAGRLYQIRAVGEWTWRASAYRYLIVESLGYAPIATPLLDFSQALNSQYLGAI